MVAAPPGGRILLGPLLPVMHKAGERAAAPHPPLHPRPTNTMHLKKTPARSAAALATGLALLGLALLVAPLGCSKVQGKGYNVLLITLDTTRADFFSCYGYPEPTTPHFDALAAAGVRFAMAISTSAVTPVSHASILTGLNPYAHGLRVLAADGGFRLRRDVPSLAPVLKDAGYATAAIHSAFPVSGHFGFDAGFDVFESFDLGIVDKGDNVGWDVSEGQRRSDATTDLVLEKLEKKKQPFFLWIHYWDPHDVMLLPPEEFIPEDAPRTPGGRIVPSSKIYAAELRFVDSQFGRLVAEMERRGLWENTLVVVVADHGEGLEDGKERHGWHAHRVLYQEQIHVPLIVRAPGGPGGRVVRDLASTVDIYPTILDYLGLEAPRGVEGRSLRRLMEGQAGEARYAYADQINFFDLNASMVRHKPDADFLFSITDGRWKLIYKPTRPDESELYDLAADPKELVNLREREREHSLRLLEELARRDGWVLEAFQMDGGGTSEESRRLLAKLGYVDDSEAEEGEARVLLSWSWVCPRDGTQGARGQSCAQCGARSVPVGRFQ